MRLILEVELILNFNDFVLNVNISGFSDLIPQYLAHIVHDINTLHGGMLVFNYLQFVLVINPILVKVEVLRLGLYICIFELVSTYYGNFILLHLFDYYYKPNKKPPCPNRIFYISSFPKIILTFPKLPTSHFRMIYSNWHIIEKVTLKIF